MKKRLLTLLLALAMLLSLTACGGKEEPEKETNGDQVEEEAPETEEEPESPEAEVEEPEAEKKPEAETPAQPEAPAQPEKPKEEKPAEGNTSSQPPAAEQKPAEPEQPAQGAGVDLNAFYESVLSAGEWPMMGPMEGETLDAFYPGLSAVPAKQSLVSMAMMGSVVAEIALVEVEDAADVEEVKEILQARISYQVGDENNPGGAWYPESIEGWKNNSRVVSNGNFVMMVAYSGCDDVVAAFNALFA